MVQIMGSPEEAKRPKKTKDDKDLAVQQSLGRIRRKFIVMSGKGGVGKTSTSVHLAVALSRKGHRVGLMDVDLHGPDIPRVLGRMEMLGISKNNKLQPIQVLENLKVVSIESLSANKDDAIIWRGPIKYSAIRQFIGDVEWGDLDFLLIDSPPGTGDEPLTVAQNIPDAKAIIVTTPQEVSLADVRKSISFCRVVNMDIFGIVENMSGHVCPHCGGEVRLFGSGGGEKTAEALGVPFLGRIPFDPKVVECGDAGKPYQEQFPDAPATRAFEAIADQMARSLEA